MVCPTRKQFDRVSLSLWHLVCNSIWPCLVWTGPDIDLIQEILSQVGKRHKDFGVQASYFPHMGEALVYGLQQVVGPGEFTENHKKAWKEVYDELSAEILKSM